MSATSTKLPCRSRRPTSEIWGRAVYTPGVPRTLIILGGGNIPVVEIESILYHHPAVRAVAIVGMPDARLGERVVAYMVVKPDASIDLPQAAFLAENLAEKKVARSYFSERVEILPEMPMTATGKI